METSVEQVNISPFLDGVRRGIPIAIGYCPIALTFGLLAKTTGLTFTETILMSLIVFAGAAQYISLNLIALGTGAMEIIITTFIVNIRHFLMSTVINEKAEEDRMINKLVYAFGITDETFSVAATKEGRLTTGFIVGVNLIGYLSWSINSGLGFMIGAALPQVLQESMAIALYAMFIGLLVPSLKQSWKVAFLAGLSASLNSVFVLTNTLSTGWSIVTATLLSSVITELVVKVKGRKRRGCK